MERKEAKKKCRKEGIEARKLMKAFRAEGRDLRGLKG